MARRSVNPMIFALFLLNSLLLGLALINFISIRKPSTIAETDASILLLLPVRNEEANIARVLTELNNQKSVPNLHVLVIDDNSEDRTHQIAQSHVSERISLVTVPEPQAGLIGKVNALQSGFNSARTADVVVRACDLRTPRIDMHKCSQSIMTITPIGLRISTSASAICVVRRSCT